MKKKLILIFIIGIYCVSCRSSGLDSKSTDNMLKLKLSFQYTGDIAYAHVFKVKVLKVISGDVAFTSGICTIMPKDSLFVNNAQKTNAVYIVTLEKGEGNVDKKYSPISGFIDDNKTAWNIRHME